MLDASYVINGLVCFQRSMGRILNKSKDKPALWSPLSYSFPMAAPPIWQHLASFPSLTISTAVVLPINVVLKAKVQFTSGGLA